MMLRFKQVDVFTTRPFFGNPVAVVLDADGLDPAAMQRIAAWTNLSETTFVQRATVPAADYRLRIFTPRSELPFAGHPTLGSAHAVVEAGIAPDKPELRQECAAGVLQLTLEGAGGERRIAVEAPPAALAPIPADARAAIERALGAPLAREGMIVSIGPRWLTGMLADAAAVRALAPDLGAIAAVSHRLGATGITVFALADSGDHDVVVRSFAPRRRRSRGSGLRKRERRGRRMARSRRRPRGRAGSLSREPVPGARARRDRERPHRPGDAAGLDWWRGSNVRGRPSASLTLARTTGFGRRGVATPAAVPYAPVRGG
jgi:PhzF family phenazine biosynthesis protein